MQQQAMGKNLKETFNKYIKYCRIRSLSDATWGYYEECIEMFMKFYAETNDTMGITKHIIGDYILYLKVILD